MSDEKLTENTVVENVKEEKTCNCPVCQFFRSDCTKKFFATILASFIGCSLALVVFTPFPRHIGKKPCPPPQMRMYDRQMPPRDFRGFHRPMPPQFDKDFRRGGDFRKPHREFRGEFRKHHRGFSGEGRPNPSVNPQPQPEQGK